MTISRRNCNRVINLYSMKLDVKSYLNGIVIHPKIAKFTPPFTPIY